MHRKILKVYYGCIWGRTSRLRFLWNVFLSYIFQIHLYRQNSSWAKMSSTLLPAYWDRFPILRRISWGHLRLFIHLLPCISSRWNSSHISPPENNSTRAPISWIGTSRGWEHAPSNLLGSCVSGCIPAFLDHGASYRCLNSLGRKRWFWSRCFHSFQALVRENRRLCMSRPWCHFHLPIPHLLYSRGLSIFWIFSGLAPSQKLSGKSLIITRFYFRGLKWNLAQRSWYVYSYSCISYTPNQVWVHFSRIQAVS